MKKTTKPTTEKRERPSANAPYDPTLAYTPYEPTREYTFVVNATITMTTTVHATSMSQAIEKAQAKGAMHLCHQCNGQDSTEKWCTELDCEPCVSPLVEVSVDGVELKDAALLEAMSDW